MENLLRVLAAEEALYERLRDLLQREWDLMVTLDAAALEETARSKEELADEGRLLEESRVAVAADLARELGLAADRPTLSQLCVGLGGESARLRDAHNRLLVLVSVVRELLDANRALAGDSLTQIRGTLRLLGGLLPSEAAYEPRTAREPASESGRLLRRTA
jgi:hypothetical protein